MDHIRRSLLAAAALAPVISPAIARAQTGLPTPPSWLRNHPAFATWDAPERPTDRFLNTRLEPDPGAERITVREWLGGVPTVLSVWATWCPPCLVEKRPEARLSLQLANAGSATRVRGLLAYDRANLEEARTRLAQLGASALDTARATEGAEQSLLWVFGFDRDRRSMHRTQTVYAQLSTSLPFTLLLDANGGLLGRITGAVSDERGRSYWEFPETFDMLQRLGAS